MVLDEAYIEFSDRPSKLGWVREHNNLVVLRTFSKSAGKHVCVGLCVCGEGVHLCTAREHNNLVVLRTFSKSAGES